MKDHIFKRIFSNGKRKRIKCPLLIVLISFLFLNIILIYYFYFSKKIPIYKKIRQNRKLTEDILDNSIEAINEYFNLIKNILKDKEIDPNNNNCEINIEDIINFSFKFDCNGPYDCSKFDSSNEKCIHSIIHDNKCDYEVLFIIDNNLEINFLSSICESNSVNYNKDFSENIIENNSTDNNNNKLVNIYTEYKNCSGLKFFLGLCRSNNTQNEPITDYNNRKNCSVLRFVLGLCPPNNTNNNNLINIYTDNKNCSGLKYFLGLCKTDNINNEKITNHNNCNGLRFFLDLCIPNNTNND